MGLIQKNPYVRALLFGVIVSTCLNSLFILAHWHAVSPNGSAGSLILAYFLVFPICAMILVAPIMLIFSIPESTRKRSFQVFLITFSYLVIAIVLGNVGSHVRMCGFRNLAGRSVPLVEAIKKFETDQGRPPSTLEELVPKYLAAVPKTGMGAYLEYAYLVGEEAQCYEGNPWVLIVHTPRGYSSDMFVYFPNGNYPEYAYSSHLERIEDWAYCWE